MGDGTSWNSTGKPYASRGTSRYNRVSLLTGIYVDTFSVFLCPRGVGVVVLTEFEFDPILRSLESCPQTIWLGRRALLWRLYFDSSSFVKLYWSVKEELYAWGTPSFSSVSIETELVSLALEWLIVNIRITCLPWAFAFAILRFSRLYCFLFIASIRLSR